MPRPAIHRNRTLGLPPSGLRLAVVSDTHSSPHPDAYALVAREKPDAILHAGDVGDLGVVDRFAEIAETIAVRGNIDERAAELPDSVLVAVGAASGPQLRVLLTHIAVYGPRLRPQARALAQTHEADLVVLGHSHMPLIGRDGPFGLFNPGSVGPRRFRLPITFGVLDIRESGVSFRHVDCETGQRWSPAG